MLPDPHTNTPSSVRVRPRRKGGEWVTITLNTVSTFFDFTLTDAAHALSMSPTALKTVCRRLGIARWPYSRRSARAAASSSAHATTSSPFSIDEPLFPPPPPDSPAASPDTAPWILAADHFDDITDFSYLVG